MRDADLTFDCASQVSEKNPSVAPPLKVSDCSQITDGSASLVLVSEKFLEKLGRDKSKTPRLLGFGHTTDYLPLDKKDAPTFSIARKAAEQAFGMQFGRAALRARELAIRGALGATRWRLVRQMLTESFLVAFFGAIVGVVMAFWSISLLISATNGLPFPLPYWINFNIDPKVLAFTLAIVFVATLLSGFIPAILSARGNTAEMMKEGGRGNSSRLVNIITRTLVVGQIALTAALLIAAVLQIKSIRNQIKLDYGYDENGVYCARMGLMEGDYPTTEARQQFFARSLRMLRANPAFESAALTGRFRMTFGGFGQYEVDGQNYVTDRDRPQGNFEFVSDGYFSAIGLKVIEGRDFTMWKVLPRNARWSLTAAWRWGRMARCVRLVR